MYSCVYPYACRLCTHVDGMSQLIFLEVQGMYSTHGMPIFVNCSARTKEAGLHTREFFVCEEKHMTDQQEMVW